MTGFKRFLTESPHLKGGEYTPGSNADGDSFISDSSLQRKYEEIGNTTRDNETFYIYRIVKGGDKIVRVVTPGKNMFDQDSNLIVTTIHFKYHPSSHKLPKDIDREKVYQVNGVYTKNKYRDIGLTSFAYLCLAKSGYTVISDTVQYEDGKELWKSLAKKSGLLFKIRILKGGDYMKDDSGKIIEYEAENPPDESLWSTGGSGAPKTDITFMIYGI